MNMGTDVQRSELQGLKPAETRYLVDDGATTDAIVRRWEQYGHRSKNVRGQRKQVLNAEKVKEGFNRACRLHLGPVRTDLQRASWSLFSCWRRPCRSSMYFSPNTFFDLFSWSECGLDKTFLRPGFWVKSNVLPLFRLTRTTFGSSIVNACRWLYLFYRSGAA
ncbi:hypothetical protein GALMADRAFT_1354789 [Galerina marginata CBS 339.88]|uniref:Uncharacterized protein n=1 Tax=Galerina marginata (strain CBS 339.88) TaxID=685588 RepID=A0A067SBL1_GALM3|nr:hypothetical protein GALMADRAFT_1354789 [Galerina marginata CBS 339.88]